ncbi:hypothetical protein MUK42_09565 [Musa troglodytarum]|uniref:Uncharacterized protein n=1 Tax=Musa troglodytarum TaxID=320322 RepID=A0A9E7KJD2_9LILI|nr:hypothetical protein MUK42_09565 [Musa troglodytarum]
MEPSSWDDAPLLEPEGRDLIGTGNPDHLLSQLAWNGVDLSPTRSLAVAFGLYALSRFAMLTNASSAAECCYYKMLVRYLHIRVGGLTRLSSSILFAMPCFQMTLLCEADAALDEHDTEDNVICFYFIQVAETTAFITSKAIKFSERELCFPFKLNPVGGHRMIARVGDGETWSQVDHERKMTFIATNAEQCIVIGSVEEKRQINLEFV